MGPLGPYLCPRPPHLVRVGVRGAENRARVQWARERRLLDMSVAMGTVPFELANDKFVSFRDLKEATNEV